MSDYKAEDLYQNHGDHIDGIMPTSDFIDNLSNYIQEAKLREVADTHVCLEGYLGKSRVMGLTYGDGRHDFMMIIANNPERGSNEFVSAYPMLSDGAEYDVVITKVLKWENGLEATIICRHGQWQFAFFPTDYFYSKGAYREGEVVRVRLAALGMRVEAADTGFEFTGQQALDFLAHTGQEPDYQADGTVEPVRFSTMRLVAYLNLNDKAPDEAEFQSPAADPEAVSFLGGSYYRAGICVHRESRGGDDEQEVRVPLYFRRDMMESLGESQPIRGWLWMSGCLACDCDSDAPAAARAFHRVIRGMSRCEEIQPGDDLEWLHSLMPDVRLKEGYRLSCCKVGNEYGHTTHLYVRRDGSEPIIGRISPPDYEQMPGVLNYYEIPFTEEGVAQAWLLDKMNYLLPRSWHAHYGSRRFLSSRADFETLDFRPGDKPLSPRDEEWNRRLRAIPNLADYRPRVVIDGDRATLSFCFFSPFRGLVGVTVQAVRHGRTIKFTKDTSFVIIDYNCGIVF